MNDKLIRKENAARVIEECLRKGINPELAMVADGFSQYLGLLFVPAAVGVVLFLPQLKANALAIASALVGSVILTIGSSALVARLLSEKQKAQNE